MPGKEDILAACGTVLAGLSTLFIVLGFSSSNWLESFKESRSRFDKMGLWSACFNHFGYDRDYLGKEYNGCFWIYSYEYKPIFDWLNPRWFLTVQVTMTLALILCIVTSVLCSLGWLEKICPPSSKTTAQLVNSLLMFSVGIMIAFSVTLFGIKANVDRQWLPRPDQNFLSWSFGLSVIAGFFAIFSAMCLLFDHMRLKYDNDKKRSQADPYMTYKMKPVHPPPDYEERQL